MEEEEERERKRKRRKRRKTMITIEKGKTIATFKRSKTWR